MASPLMRWLGVTALVLVVLGALYLPPRGMPSWAQSRMRIIPDNESRLRARKLGAEWVEVNALLQELRHRPRIDSALRARRAAGQGGPALIVEGPDTAVARMTPALQASLDALWKDLGLAETKIAFAVIARDPTWSSSAMQSRLHRLEISGYGYSFILPDTANHTTCLAQARYPGWYKSARFIQPRQLQFWAVRVLGPCAYYARFGVPSRRVEQWLASRKFDLAVYPGWQEPAFSRSSAIDEEAPWTIDRWFWQSWYYDLPPEAAACYGGRPLACRNAIAFGDRPRTDAPRPRAVLPYETWTARKVRLAGSESYLSEVLRDVGAERFQEFWTSELPVDSALTVALREPVGEYTAKYQRKQGKAPRFGASAAPLDVALSLLLSLVVVGLTLVAQGRREVR